METSCAQLKICVLALVLICCLGLQETKARAFQFQWPSFLSQSRSVVRYEVPGVAAQRRDHVPTSESSNDGPHLLTIHHHTSIHETTQKFLSLCLGSTIFQVARWEKFKTRSPKLQALAASLAPADIRIGGTSADFLTFDPTAQMKDKMSSETLYMSDDFEFDSGYFQGNWGVPVKNFTLTGNQWNTMTRFLEKVGWDLMFDFNLFKWKDGLWDPSNAELLLNYSAARNISIPYFQLGNEPNSFQHNFNFTISPETLVKDFKILKELITKYDQYKDGLLYGPDVTSLDRHVQARQYLTQFVAAGAYDVVDEYGLHQYYLDGRTAKAKDFLRESTMNTLKTTLRHGLEISGQSPNPRPLRLTETSSCFGGGAPGLSNAYVAGFLWLDKLGVAAQMGVTRVFRQTFYGGSYSLISPTLDPYPDLYLSVLYKNLIEGPVFNVSHHPVAPGLRVYAHCARKDRYAAGAIVLYYLNLKSKNTVISLDQFKDYDLDLYQLTPGDKDGLQSRFVKLNGVTLRMSGLKMPSMEPVSHKGDVTAEAQSFGFIVVPHAGASLCVDYFNGHKRKK